MALVLRRKRVPTRSTNSPPPDPPVTLVVHSDVIRSVTAAAAASPSRETGGPLIGTIQPSWVDGRRGFIVAVLATVDPAGTLAAGPASVGLGRSGDGERSASALRWWRDVTGLDLRHLGDWHKHLGGPPRPSEGDRVTALRMSSESAAPVWLSAIAVCDRADDEDLVGAGHCAHLTVVGSTSGEVGFFRATNRRGLTPIAARVEDELIPTLPPLPWHVADPMRFMAECRLLAAEGFKVAIEPTMVNGGAGLKVRIRPKDGAPLTLATAAGYPLRPPKAFDDRGRPISLHSEWSPYRFLVDVAKEAAR